MTDLRAAAQAVVAALQDGEADYDITQAIDALRAALAEPICANCRYWIWQHDCHVCMAASRAYRYIDTRDSDTCSVHELLA